MVVLNLHAFVGPFLKDSNNNLAPTIYCLGSITLAHPPSRQKNHACIRHSSSLLSQWLYARSLRYNVGRACSTLLPMYPRFRLLSPRFVQQCLLILLTTTTALPALQIRQAACLGVDISYLLVALRIEAGKSLTSRRAHRFLEI